jgi:hypothetical protein
MLMKLSPNIFLIQFKIISHGHETTLNLKCKFEPPIICMHKITFRIGKTQFLILRINIASINSIFQRFILPVDITFQEQIIFRDQQYGIFEVL